MDMQHGSGNPSSEIDGPTGGAGPESVYSFVNKKTLHIRKVLIPVFVRGELAALLETWEVL